MSVKCTGEFGATINTRIVIRTRERLRCIEQTEKMGDNFTRSLLVTLEDDLVAEHFRLILQPIIDSKLELVTSAL